MPHIFDFTMTVHEQFELAKFMLMNVSVKGEQDRRRFNRCFDTLGLDRYEDRIASSPKGVIDQMTRAEVDQLMRATNLSEEEKRAPDVCVKVSSDNVAFLKQMSDDVGLSGAGCRSVGRLIDRLIDLKDSEEKDKN
jgi:hypothetical protein